MQPEQPRADSGHAAPLGGDYVAALAWLHDRIDWERGPLDRTMRERLLLARPAALLARLGDPQRRYEVVLVAGTKGKGSTAALLASILAAAGRRVGLYSQPHLHSFRERIRVDDGPITPADLIGGVARLQGHVAALERERPDLGALTTYEVATALALDHFARVGIDVAVLEIGLGGRLDAVNVVDATLAVITAISHDHTAILGETLPEIAAEKAGIIKPGRPILTARQRPEVLAVLATIAASRSAPLGASGRDWTWHGDHAALAVTAAARPDLWPRPWHHTGLRIPLLGAHQLENAATAVAAAEALTADGVAPDTVARGVAGTRWPARLEVFRPTNEDEPTIVVDGAHNGDSAEKLAVALRDHFHCARLWLILGVGVDKDLPAIVAPLAPLVGGAWAAASRHARSRPAAEVAEALGAAGVPAASAADAAAALRLARAASGPDDLICVTGSLFIAAEAREALGVVGPDERDPPLALRG